MSKTRLECIVKEPNTSANACIIWLHGLGADGNDFVDIVPQLHLPEALSVRFIFPHAPVRPVTVNGGMPCRAWYDIYDLSSLQREDDVGINQSEQAIVQLINEQVAQGIPCHRIVLVGFSQGGAVAQYTALRYPQRLGGIVGLSTYLPFAEQLVANHVGLAYPVFLAHGQRDLMLPIVLGKRSVPLLQQMGCQVSWHEYPMEHQVCGQEINELSHWLSQVLD